MTKKSILVGAKGRHLVQIELSPEQQKELAEIKSKLDVKGLEIAKDKHNCIGCNEKLSWLKSAREHAKNQKEKIKQLNNYIGELELELQKYNQNWRR